MTNNEAAAELTMTAIAIENRKIEAAGHAATMAHLAAQERCDCDCTLCAYAKRHPQLGARRCWE